MSTRATYRFQGFRESDDPHDPNHRDFNGRYEHPRAVHRPHDPVTVVYIHHNGHPEGAAWYLYTTVCNPSAGNFATQFIRANHNAEITKSHELHGDTDYQYDIFGTGLAARVVGRKTNRDLGAETPTTCYAGTVLSLVTQYLSRYEEFRPFVRVQYLYVQVWLNEPLAMLELSNPDGHGILDHLRLWAGKYEGGSNWRNMIAKLRTIVTAFPALCTEETTEFLLPSRPLKWQIANSKPATGSS